MKNPFFSIVAAFLFTFSFYLYPNLVDCKPSLAKLAVQARDKNLASDPVALLTAEEGLIKSGPIFKRWDPELATSIYSTVAEPRQDGSVPWVPKNAKAVVIFLHGSGTAKASGKNFAENQNILRPAGIAGISLDLPFHGDNKGSEKLKTMDGFMDWMHQFVEKVKKEADATGKKIPIYMMGHSFGPGVIQEYVERYPKDLKDFLLMSPAGDFHPALKYTYEKITTPGEKFLEGEPIVENAAGGEWAGQLDGQFTWPKRGPFDRMPGRMLIGELDEWWPGNKELARKVGVEQPYEFNQPLEYFRKKYPGMKITTIPNVGHMLFNATAANGRNLVRESIFDMVGIPETDRNPPGLPVSPSERIALLYQSSPVFRQWIGNRYPYSFRDEFRVNGVLKDWENAKYQAWRSVLERLSQEHPEFARSRGYSLAIAQQKASAKEPNLDAVTKKLQHDLVGYLTGTEKQKADILAQPDSEIPKPLKLQASAVDKGWAPTKSGATGPVTLASFLEKIKAKGATKIESTSLESKGVRLSYEVEGKQYENYVLDYSPQELEKKVYELYLKAYERNHFAAPGDTIEILDEGILWKFSAKDKANVTMLQVSPH